MFMKISRRTFSFFLTIAFMFLFQTTLFSQDSKWTHFRGSKLNGISTETNVPISWNDTTNVAWKTDIKGKGWASPVVYGEQVWISTATNDGKEMWGECIDLKTGKLIYDILLFKQDSVHRKHSINSYATPTPCIEDGFVYLNYGSRGTACVNTTNGEIVWKRNDLVVEHIQGTGASLMLYKEMLIVHYEGTDFQYIIAFNKRTGEIIWRADRPKELYTGIEPIGKKSYCTPLVININGKDLMISNGSTVCIAYEIETGKEVWRVVEGEDSSIAMPIYEDGIVYFYTSLMTPPGNGEKFVEFLAIDATGTGDITKTNILWRHKGPILQLLTPLIKEGVIYTVDTKNTLIVFDAKTGAQTYTQKLKEKYHSSPLWVEGKVYLTSVKGETIVLKAGKIPEMISTNKVEGDVYATLAIVQNSILIRTDMSLFRIKGK
jgi:outer membrane protein assembly factor BamB